MKKYYNFKVETVNNENETINIIECKTKRDVKKVINTYNFPSHYRTVKTNNNKLVLEVNQFTLMIKGLQVLQQRQKLKTL